MTRALAIIAAARADIRLYERLVDLACMVAMAAYVFLAVVLP